MSRRRWSGWFLPPLVVLALLTTAARADTLIDSINVTPHGGRVLENVHVAAIFWGGWWDATLDGKELQSYLIAFFQDLFADGRFTKNLDNQYSLPGHSIGNGTLDQVVVFRVLDGSGMEVKPPATLARQDITSKLVELVNERKLRAPDPSRLYFFFLPAGTVWDQGDYAFHNSYWPNPSGPWYVYAACFYHNPVLMTSNVSHELAEAVTDPIRFQGEFAWYDDSLGPESGEIADIPKSLWVAGKIEDDDLWDVLVREGRYYLVQKVWCQNGQRIAAFP